MYHKGWEMLELMGWTPAWLSRTVHTLLKYVPGYNHLTHWWVKRKFKKVLDFGCGQGITLLELRAKDKIDIIGLDPYSPAKSSHIYRQQLADTHFPNNAFDGIFSIETVEHLPNVREVFAELSRILKPGGVLLVQTRRLEDPDYSDQQGKWFYLREPKTHVSIYSKTSMRTIAKESGFRDVRFRGVRLARFVK